MIKLSWLLAALICIGAISCSKKKTEQAEPVVIQTTPYNTERLATFPFDANEILPQGSDSAGFQLKDSLEIVRPDRAPAYFGPTAESYLIYQFIGLTAGTYQVQGGLIFVEIAQFADDSYAYGFYAGQRPDDAQIQPFGVEGYTTGNSTYFTKGDYVVTLSVDGDPSGLQSTLRSLIVAIAGKIEGSPRPPGYYMLFPHSGQLAASQKYYPWEFLGVPRFNQVYTADYASADNRFTLFLTMDESGVRFLALKEYAETLGGSVSVAEGFGFEPGLSVMFNIPGKGQIVAGLVRSKLVGAVGYNPAADEKRVKGWVTGLQ